MSSPFQDQMASDLANVFLDPDVFGDNATYVPTEQPGQSFPLIVVVGDHQTSAVQMSGGQEGVAMASIDASLAVILSGLFQILGSQRYPHRGDQIVIASGNNAGTWIVAGPAARDAGGGAKLDCFLTTLDAPGGRDTREVR